MQPRDEKGRLVPVNCPDPNCGGGVLVHEIHRSSWGTERHTWRCDGLTYATETGPLIACDRFVFGPLVEREAA